MTFIRAFFIAIVLCLNACTSSRPFVTVVNPEDGACISGTADIRAEVTGDRVARVEFFIDGEFYATAMQVPFRTLWETHYLGDSTFHTIVAKAYNRTDHVALSEPVLVLVDNTQGKPRNRLHLVSGRINDSEIDASDPLVTVRPGQDITGDIVVRADNKGDPSWGAPLGGTPSWGDHILNYWETGICLPGGVSEHSVDMYLQAPVENGLYYIFLAWGHETDCSHVMALSYWRYEDSPEWRDDHDIADWTDEQAQMAIDSGYVRSTYRYDETGYGIKYVPAIAIRLHVTDRER